MAIATSPRTNGSATTERYDRPEPTGWANSAPLALAAFAVCAFMLSMINAHAVNAAATPYVWGAGFAFGGITQLVAGLIQLRTGNTFTGVLFSAYGAFWLSLFAIVELFQPSVPLDQRGPALGLFLYAFGGFTLYMLLASFRTNVVTVVALAALVATLFLLASGNYFAHGGLIEAGGWTGLVVAALASYLSFAGVAEASYGRPVAPVGDLSQI